jgi:predicted small metal-binding protein
MTRPSAASTSQLAGLAAVRAKSVDRRGELAPPTTGREDRSGLTWRLAMALRIVCMCGYVIQGGDDDELWRNVQGHMGVLHPELVGNVTREDILAQAEQL